MSLSAFDQADRLSQRRAERRRHTDAEDEDASADASISAPEPAADGVDVASDGESRSVTTVGGGSETTAESMEDLEDSLPRLSHEQIRENARRFLDDARAIEARPSASDEAAGTSGGGGAGASIRWNRPMGVVGRARSEPSRRGGLGGAASDGGDRRKTFSDRSMFHGESVRHLLNQVSRRMHPPEEKEGDAVEDGGGGGGGGDSGGGGGGGGGGGRSFVGVSLWANQRGSSGTGTDGDSGSNGSNLAPRGGDVLVEWQPQTRGGTGLGKKSSSKKMTDGNACGASLGYDPDNDDNETLREKMGYACHRAWGGCARACRTTKHQCLSRPNMVLMLVIGSVIAAIVTISVTVYDGEKEFILATGRGKEPETETDLDDELPEIRDAATAVRFGRIKERILESGASDPDVLEPPVASDEKAPPPTAQYRALAWIAEEDPAVLDPEDEFLIQRYALAVFWYSTYEAARERDAQSPLPSDGEIRGNWDNRTNWLTGRGLCAWHGVSCHHREGTGASGIHYDDDNGITALNLTDNDIRGALPPELFRALTDTRHLDLSYNLLTGTLPDDLGAMARLESLYLFSNNIGGTLPASVGRLTELRNLYLHDNLFDGALPAELGDLANLHNLGLFRNYFTGTVPPSVGDLSGLRSLYLDSNRLTGPVPTTLFALSDLVDLRLSENELSGTLPSDPTLWDGLGDKLEVLHLDSNGLSGPLPSALGGLGHLTELTLGDNRFTGTLPLEWDGLVDLVRLEAEDNDLGGTVPFEWGLAMSDLRSLNLGGNRIGGMIPPSISGMEELRELKVNDNEIGGTLPSVLGDMFNLETIHLHNNRLIDGVPSEMGRLIHLKSLRVHGNAITGTMPPELCDLTEDDALRDLTSDCGGEDPPVRCGCCSECFEGKAEVESGLRP